MQSGHLLIQFLGQGVNARFQFAGGQFQLREALIGKAVAHHKAGVTGRAAEIHQTSLGKDDYASTGFQRPFVHLRLDGPTLAPGRIFQVMHIDLTVKMTDVADDGLVFHLFHLPAGDHVAAAGRRDEDIPFGKDVIEGGHLVPLHGRLQGADRIDFHDDHAGAETPHGLGASLADIAVTADDHRLSGHHDVRGPFDAVGQRFPAAVKIVEFRLGHRIVYIDGRKEEFSILGHLVETVHPRRGFLGNAADPGCHLMPVLRRPLQAVGETLPDNL